MLLKLSHPATGPEHDFFLTVLSEQDVIMLSDAALSLAFQPNPYPARGVVINTDIRRAGGTIHDSWAVISHQDWVRLLENHTKQISW